MKIDHIAIAVKSVESAAQFWEKAFGYKRMTTIVENTRQKVKVLFLRKEGSIDIKLIEPSDESSPVFRFIQKNSGLHHICFRCGNIEEEIKRLKGMGLRLMAGPQPGEAFENEDIAFLLAQGGINMELIDTDKRAGLIPENDGENNEQV